MALRWLAAGLLAALQWAGAQAVVAADIYSPYDPPRAEAPDDDPRYGDIYRLPPPPYAGRRYGGPRDPAPRYGEPWGPPRYAERHDGPYGRGEYLPPMRGPRYHDLYSRYSEPGGECVPRQYIRRLLREDGWGAFHDIDVRGEVAVVRASRPNGDLYELKVDRCTGRILRARALDEGPGPYAWRRREPHPAY